MHNFNISICFKSSFKKNIYKTDISHFESFPRCVFPPLGLPLYLPVLGSKSSGPFSAFSDNGPGILSLTYSFWSLVGLSPKPFAIFLYFALFLPWGQARDSIQGPLVSDQLDSIPNLGLNPWLQAKVHKQPLSARQFITFTTRPGPRWAVLPGWTEFRPMGCREGFSIVFETGWELFHVASEYENCIELSVQHHAASHPKESWLQKICLFHPFSSLFILFYAWFVANLSLGPSLHRERPLLRSCGWSFASLQLPFHSDTLVSVSRCRKSPIMLHRVMFLLLGRMAP